MRQIGVSLAILKNGRRGRNTVQVLEPRPGHNLVNMAENRNKGEDEVVFDVMDLAEYAKRQRWWNRVFGKNSGPIAEKHSVATQLAIGGATGWCAGFLFKKVGKVAASAVGGGFFLLQMANHTGYITIDWKRVEQDVNKAKKQLKLNAERPPAEVRTKVDEITTFVKKNIILTGGFAGGFLLGLAS